MVAGVDDLPVPVVDLQHLDPFSIRFQPARVVGLAAPLGVEGGAVQYNIKALVPLFTGKDLGLKFNQECVLFVELFRHR